MEQVPQTVFTSGESQGDLRRLGERLVAKYMDEVAPTVEPAAVELDVQGAIAGVAVRGRVDVLDVEGRLIDFKTAPRRSARMTHLCSLKPTHTTNRICPRLPAGKNEQSPPPCFFFFVTRSFFPNQFVFTGGPGGRAVLLPGGKSATAPVWWWVTFGEQSRVISRECRRHNQNKSILGAAEVWARRRLGLRRRKFDPTAGRGREANTAEAVCLLLP